MNFYRVIDANINRAAEGLRVLEDYARFVRCNKPADKIIRNARHMVRSLYSSEKMIRYRNSLEDIGLDVSLASRSDERDGEASFVVANCKRVQEAIRSIEEALKLVGEYEIAKSYELVRFSCYEIEKQLSRLRFPFKAGVYGMTGENFSHGRSSIEIAAQLLAGGVQVLQYREKHKTKKDRYVDCMEIRKMTQITGGVIFIVNDDVDIAMAVGADGVHVGQDDMPVGEIKRSCPSLLVGVSTHNPEQAKAAEHDGADYLGIGPLFQTTSKQDVESSAGIAYLQWAVDNIDIPLVAIGGIDQTRALMAVRAGADHVAIISHILNDVSICERVRQINIMVQEEREIMNAGGIR